MRQFARAFAAAALLALLLGGCATPLAAADGSLPQPPCAAVRSARCARPCRLWHLPAKPLQPARWEDLPRLARRRSGAGLRGLPRILQGRSPPSRPGPASATTPARLPRPTARPSAPFSKRGSRPTRR
ncbi:MAG: hypothetical protein MZW92_01120 [Comamonadaceae bacterium]|nr:hypothetical protein [Comamonadaceae bacterium]